MRLKWLGHAAFLIESDTGTRIITDPYESGGYGGAVGYGPITDEADVVVISHGHPDHAYVEGVPGSPVVVKGPGTHQASGIEFTGVPCFHDESGGTERGKNSMQVFEVDGMRICHVGDLGHQPTDEQVKALGRVDVLLVTVGGYYTIDAGEATKFAERLDPRVIVPMHYRTDKCTFPIASVEDFLEGKTRVRKPGSSEVLLVKESLPVETEVIVLDHAL